MLAVLLLHPLQALPRAAEPTRSLHAKSLTVTTSQPDDAVWPGMMHQWGLAQAGYPSAKPSLLSTDDALTRYLGTSLTEGVYHAVPPPHLHDVCTASWKGTKLLYVQIYKVNTNGICANLMKMSDGSATNRVFGFTFVREPLGRFSSGFSEISWRTARDGKKGDKVCSQ